MGLACTVMKERIRQNQRENTLNRIDTIIMDIGNVLAQYRWKDYLRSFSFSEETFQKLSKAIFLSPAWDEFDRGAKSDEEILQMIDKNAPELQKEISMVLSPKWKDLVWEYDFSEQWIKELKGKGYRVLVLSNYGKTLFGLAKENFRFLKWVDGGVISYEIKHIKPEREIFDALIQKYHVVPRQSVFLDDLPANTEAAARLGFHTVTVTSHEAAVKELARLLGEKS